MGLSFSNPKRSVERNKRPHETCSQICSTRTYAILAISQSFAISQYTSSESTMHSIRNALSILTLRSLKSTKPVAYLRHHVDRCNTGHYTCSLTLRRMNSPRARKWSRKKLSDTARGRPTEPREHLRIAHLSVNATQLHQKSNLH